MIRRPPRSTRTDTLFPYTTLFRSQGKLDELISPLILERDFTVVATISLENPHFVERIYKIRPEIEAARDIEPPDTRSEEHTSELQSLMRNSYAVFCLKTKTPKNKIPCQQHTQENTE